MAKIILVEDDPQVSEYLKDWLIREKHCVDVIADGRLGLEEINKNNYDLAVLDWQLPGMDGVDVSLALREKGNTIPILMLTGRSSIDDRVQGIESGAYDYLVKPCSLIEFSARVRALLRRAMVKEERCFIVGDLEIKFDSHEVLLAGKHLKLSPGEFEILRVLAYNPDGPSSLSSLHARISAQSPLVSEALVKSQIKSLKKKLAEEGSKVAVSTDKNGFYFVEIP